jgi:hypothetical protein
VCIRGYHYLHTKVPPVLKYYFLRSTKVVLDMSIHPNFDKFKTRFIGRRECYRTWGEVKLAINLARKSRLEGLLIQESSSNMKHKWIMLDHPFPDKAQYITIKNINYNQSLREHWWYEKLAKTSSMQAAKLRREKKRIRDRLWTATPNHPFMTCGPQEWFFKSNVCRKGPRRNRRCCRMKPHKGGSRVFTLKIKSEQTPSGAFNRWTTRKQRRWRIHPIKLRLS